MVQGNSHSLMGPVKKAFNLLIRLALESSKAFCGPRPGITTV